jgi:hypothetical protein
MTGYTAQIVDRLNTARCATLITSGDISEKDARRAARRACGSLADSTGRGWVVADFYATPAPPARLERLYSDLAASLVDEAERRGALLDSWTAVSLIEEHAAILTVNQRRQLEPLVRAAMDARRAAIAHGH